MPPAKSAPALEDTRDRLIACLEIAFALAGGVVVALAAWRLMSFAPNLGTSVVKALADRIPLSDEVREALGIDLAGSLAAPAVGFLGGGWLCWKARRLVGLIADRLFPPFDTDLFRPIGRSGALDPLWLPPLGADPGMKPLPWIPPPPDSPRRAVWDTLIAFLSNHVGDGRFDIFGYRRVPFARFRWLVVTGQPGAGKTRIATEIARARARREVMGDSQTHDGPFGEDLKRESRIARRRLTLGAWLRRASPFARQLEPAAPGLRDGSPWDGADPWDAGWVVAASGSGPILHVQSTQFDEGVLARLRAWRPRRPTVLVLDDPRPGKSGTSGAAGQVIGALLSGETGYRHPVRLIIVSQTLPVELGLKTAPIDCTWSAGPRGFAEAVLALGIAAPLSAGEVRRMFGALKLSHRTSGWKPTDENVGRLLRRAHGNPLLVCLALQQIQRRLPDDGIPSSAVLLLDRAQRIVEALEAAGVGTAGHLRSIAWATLVAGAETMAEAPSEAVLGGWSLFEPAALEAVPNLGLIWPSPAPPRVQPEPIGDAFVQLVLSDRLCDTATRRRVVASAWRASPLAMLAAMRRSAAWQAIPSATGPAVGTDSGQDAVAAELRLGPPPDADLDEIDVALAYVAAAIRIGRQEWDAGEVPRPGPPLAAALRHIRALPPYHAASSFVRLVDLLDVPNAVAIVRGRAALLCICTTLRRGLQDENAWRAPDEAGSALAALTRALRLLHRWGADPSRHYRLSQVLGDLVKRAVSGGDGPPAEGLIDDLERAAWRPGTMSRRWTASVLCALSQCFAGCAETSAATTTRAHRLEARAAALLDKKDVVEECAVAVDDLSRPFAGERDFELERAIVWRSVAFARRNDAAGCEAAARQVDDLARPFAGARPSGGSVRWPGATSPTHARTMPQAARTRPGRSTTWPGPSPASATSSCSALKHGATSPMRAVTMPPAARGRPGRSTTWPGPSLVSATSRCTVRWPGAGWPMRVATMPQAARARPDRSTT